MSTDPCTDSFALAESAVTWCRSGSQKRSFTASGQEGGPAYTVATATYVNAPHGGIKDLIETIKNTLISAGWTLIEDPTLKASGNLYAPGWVAAYSPLTFENITPNNDLCSCITDCPRPPFGLGGGGCRTGCWNLGKGCCGDGSCCHTCEDSGEKCNGHFTGTFDSLIASLNSCLCKPPISGYCFSDRPGSWQQTGFSPVTGLPVFSFVPDVGAVRDGNNIFVQSVLLGPEWDLPYFKTEIGVGFAIDGGPAGTVAGGGYRLRSQAANGHTQCDVTLTMTRDTGALSVEVTELLTNSKVQYRLLTGRNVGLGFSQVPRYLIAAGPYQLAMIDLANANDGSGSFGFGGNSILITAPWTDDPTLLYSLVVIGPGMLMNSTVWEAFPCSFAINGPFQTYAPSNFNPEPNSAGLAVREYSFDQPLLTTNLRALIQNGWIMGAPSRFAEASVLGKIWDWLSISQAYQQGAKQAIGTYDFAQISRRTAGTVSSGWVALGDNRKVEDLPLCSGD